MSIDQLADMLGRSPKTLETWRREGSGPPFTKNGRSIYYSRRDVEAWRIAKRNDNTEEAAPYKPTMSLSRRMDDDL
jgi:DNA-binding transcriptional MerR regulator